MKKSVMILSVLVTGLMMVACGNIEGDRNVADSHNVSTSDSHDINTHTETTQNTRVPDASSNVDVNNSFDVDCAGVLADGGVVNVTAKVKAEGNNGDFSIDVNDLHLVPGVFFLEENTTVFYAIDEDIVLPSNATDNNVTLDVLLQSTYKGIVTVIGRGFCLQPALVPEIVPDVNDTNDTNSTVIG